MQTDLYKNVEINSTPSEIAPTTRLKSQVSSDGHAGKQTNSQVKQQIPFLMANIEVLFKHQEFELAFHLIRQCLNQESSHPGVLRKLAFYLEHKGQYEKALRVYEELVKNDYEFSTVAALAKTHYILGQDEKAFELYQEALSLVTEDAPNLFDVYKNLGNIYVRQGDFDAAEEFYCKAFTLEAQSDILQVNLGTLALQKNDHQEALERFRSALAINNQNDKAWVGLAMVHNTMGDLELAFGNLEKALDVNPLNKTAIQLLSQCAVREMKYDVAIERAQRFVSQGDFDEDVSLLLVHLLCLNLKFGLAKLEIERCLLWQPENKKFISLEKELRTA